VTPIEAVVRGRIRQGGPLSFRDVMQLALYHPEHGYYSNLTGFGADGDFTTSPETHPSFGFLLARQVADVWEVLGRPTPLRVLELGGGTGALAAPLLSALQDDSIEVSYRVDESSRSLGKRLAQRAIATVSPRGTHHLVLANEVLDAQPVCRVTVRDGHVRELRVGVDAWDNLTWIEADATDEIEAYFERLGFMPPDGSIAEINPDLQAWFTALAARLERGLAVVLDYGYTAEALFSRPQGTLLTYWRHTLGSDPLVRLGHQDISVHVDFSSAAMAAQAAGLRVVGVTSQRALLRNLGIDSIQTRLRDPTDRHALGQLCDPNGLGRIGVLFLTQGLGDYVPVGLSGLRDWPEPRSVPLLPPDDADREFLDQWREVFADP
jgi:SAM-dependent MidA family methyltransferase